MKSKKPYNTPHMQHYGINLELMAKREWKVFYSVPRKQEHDQRYGCDRCMGVRDCEKERGPEVYEACSNQGTIRCYKNCCGCEENFLSKLEKKKNG